MYVVSTGVTKIYRSRIPGPGRVVPVVNNDDDSDDDGDEYTRKIQARGKNIKFFFFFTNKYIFRIKRQPVWEGISFFKSKNVFGTNLNETPEKNVTNESGTNFLNLQYCDIVFKSKKKKQKMPVCTCDYHRNVSWWDHGGWLSNFWKIITKIRDNMIEQTQRNDILLKLII